MPKPEIKTMNATILSIHHPHGDWMELSSTGGIVYISVFGPRRALKAGCAIYFEDLQAAVKKMSKAEDKPVQPRHVTIGMP